MPDKKSRRERSVDAKPRVVLAPESNARDGDLDENEETFAHILKRIVHAKIARQNAIRAER
jgi:hypothetical protein